MTGLEHTMATKKLDALLEKAFDAMEESDFEAALDLAEEALKEQAGQRDAWLLKATCLDALGDEDAAQHEYEALTEAFPDDAEVWVRVGDFCHFSAGDLDAAEDALKTALEIAEEEGDGGPDEEMAFEAHLRLAQLYMDTGDLEDALTHAQDARGMDRDSADAEVAVGEVLFELGRFDDAGKSASKAVDKDNRHAGAYFLRGMVLERAGTSDAATKAYEKARTLDPETFTPSMQMTDDALLDAVAEAMGELPSEHQGFLKDIKLTVQALPSDEDVRVSHVSPSAPLAFKGLPLDDDPGDAKPRELLLFKSNMLRNRHDRDALMESLVPTLGMEVDLFLSDDEEQGLPQDLPN
jgi:tetratricopeptide (TPR) repeat protein